MKPVVLPLDVDPSVRDLLCGWADRQHGQVVTSGDDRAPLPASRIVVGVLPAGLRAIPEAVARQAGSAGGIVLLAQDRLIGGRQSLSDGLVQLVQHPVDAAVLQEALQEAWQSTMRYAVHARYERCEFARVVSAPTAPPDITVQEQAQRIELRRTGGGALIVVERVDAVIRIATWADDVAVVVAGRRFPQVAQVGHKHHGIVLRSHDLVGVAAGRALDVTTRVRGALTDSIASAPQAIAQSLSGFCLQVW
jgi:hypothetical protein